MNKPNLTLVTGSKEVELKIESDFWAPSIAAIIKVLKQYLEDNQENENVNASPEYQLLQELYDFLLEDWKNGGKDITKKGFATFSSTLRKVKVQGKNEKIGVYTLSIKDRSAIFILNAILQAIEDYENNPSETDNADTILPLYHLVSSEITKINNS
jgi:hypothetical protein